MTGQTQIEATYIQDGFKYCTIYNHAHSLDVTDDIVFKLIAYILCN